MISLLTIWLTTSIHYASALEKRDYSYLNDNHCTARYNCAGAQICGDHLCAPGEWEKLQAKLNAAQIGHQAGSNATKTNMPSLSTTTSVQSVPVVVCQSIKNILEGAGASSSLTAKVMADLGCT